MSSPNPALLTAVVRAFITAGEAATGGDLKSPTFLGAVDQLHDAMRGLDSSRCELEFGEDALFINAQKVRLSGSAGHRLIALLNRATNSAWFGFRCDSIPGTSQLAAVFARFARPNLRGDHPGLLSRIGAIEWLERDETLLAFGDAPPDEAPMPFDHGDLAMEASMVRKLNLKEIQEALGSDSADNLERACMLYARAVTFVERFMATMEPSAPRVPLDESARIVADIVDAWLDDPTALLAMSVARPHTGNYDAFHHANTALLSIALGSAMGMDKAGLFELGLAALLHQVGIVDMPDRIRAARVLPRDEREVLSGLPKRTALRLLQAEGPDLHAMARINALIAVGAPMATKSVDSEGKVRLRPVSNRPPLIARVITVAARYDALTSEREFRPAMKPQKALRLMSTNMRLQLDQAVVAKLARLQNISLD